MLEVNKQHADEADGLIEVNEGTEPKPHPLSNKAIKAWRILKNGIVDENPVLRLALGMCPTLALTTSVQSALGMGLSVLFVLTCSNILVSLLRNFITPGIRIPAYVVIIAAFATVAQIMCEAYLPALYQSLGLYLPLIAVNCIIFGRAEAFAGKSPVRHAFLDGVGMGAGFTVALVALATVREPLGAGTWFGFPVGITQPALIMLLAPGGFIALGLLMAVFIHPPTKTCVVRRVFWPRPRRSQLGILPIFLRCLRRGLNQNPSPPLRKF